MIANGSATRFETDSETPETIKRIPKATRYHADVLLASGMIDGEAHARILDDLYARERRERAAKHVVQSCNRLAHAVRSAVQAGIPREDINAMIQDVFSV